MSEQRENRTTFSEVKDASSNGCIPEATLYIKLLLKGNARFLSTVTAMYLTSLNKIFA